MDAQQLIHHIFPWELAPGVAADGDGSPAPEQAAVGAQATPTGAR